MKKQSITLPLSIVIALGAQLSVSAAPVSVGDDASGMLYSPITQMPANDPQLQQAIEYLKTTHCQSVSLHVKHASGRLEHRDLNHVLILGGPDVVPM